jgi:sodium transport system permease protein
MMAGGAWIVARKEMRETLRDWRTLLMMVGVPVLLYPALLIISQQIALTAFLLRDERFDVRRITLAGSESGHAASPELAGERLLQGGVAAVRRGDVDAVALLVPAPDPLGTAAVTLLYDETRDRSQRAYSLLRGSLRAWGDSLFASRVRAQQLPPSFGEPLALADSSLAKPEERGGYVLGRFLPALLILITLLGAFYPAIDLAAGEKERGTLETLLTSPVPAAQIVLGKFATIAVVAVVAAALNLASMLLTFKTGLFQLDTELGLDFVLPPVAVVWVGLVLVPLAAFFAALFLGIAVRSHSFKEAQNALTPVMMLALIPALLPILRGIDFNASLALVPVAGPGLLFRELLSGTASPGGALLVLGATTFYAGLALLFAADSFGREEVLFGSGPAGTRSGLSLRQRLRPRPRPDRTPSTGAALVFLGGLAALQFFVPPLLAARLGTEGALLLSQWLLLLLPTLLFVTLGGFDVRLTLSLRAPTRRQLGGAVLVVAGGAPVAWFLAWLQTLFMPIPQELIDALRQLLTAESAGRLLLILFMAAITPAICEEFVFRGLLLGSSRETGMARAIILNAVIFGLFHLSIFRFLPTAWLGLLLAYVVWRTRSIWTGSLMHALNNGVIIILATLPMTRDWGTSGEQAPPLLALPIGILLLAQGIRILRNSVSEL